MGDIALHFDGRPEGIPLVLLPAFPLDGRMWRFVRRELDGWVISVDPPGFGDSAPARVVVQHLGQTGAPSLETYARALAQALDAIGVERVVLAGVSMGGYVALAFAELFPERLAGIGLLDTKAEADGIEQREGRLRMAAAIATGDKARQNLAPLLDGVVSPVTKRDREDLYERLADWYEQVPASGIVWAQRAMAARPGRLQVLEGLTVPALVLRGADDSLTSAESAELMAAALGTEVVEIPDAGHLAAVEVPAAVAAALRDLWERALG